nr:hypothetical protein BaRGS_020426 [Batillaria attramentaria]
MVLWDEVLKRLLRRGKVYAAAVLSSEGELLLSIPELKIAPHEGEGLSKAVICNYDCCFKLKFNGTMFTCFHKAKNTLVGCAEETVLVGKKVHDVFIVGLSYADSPGSCIYEVTEFAKTVRRHDFKVGSRRSADMSVTSQSNT